MNKLVVVLGAVAALSLVGGVAVKANALSFKELTAKIKEGANKIVRGNGDIKAHLDRAKKTWGEWKEKAAGLAKKAKAKWRAQQSKFQGWLKKINAQRKAVSLKILEGFKKFRDDSKKWLEGAAAKAGDAVKGGEKAVEKKAE